MAIVRMIKCDVCGKTAHEHSYGSGWEGWAIIQGIASIEPKEGESLTQENMTTNLCPGHAQEVAEFITHMQRAAINKESI